MRQDLRDGDLVLRVEGAVATVLVDRPKKRNALGLSSWKALARLISEADAYEEVGLLVVRGAEGHFGAGNDIGELAELRGELQVAEEFGAAMAAAMLAVEAASKPVLMAIEGSCYGASVALALAGDLRIASHDAMFAITPSRLGAIYLASDLHRLVRAVGVGRARRLLYTGHSINADDALGIGLVDLVAPAGRFEGELRSTEEAVLAGAPSTLSTTKRMLAEVGAGAPPGETRKSLAPFVQATQGADFAEGVAAFLEGRVPRFAGHSAVPGRDH